MGFFSNLFRRPEPTTPDAIREATAEARRALALRPVAVLHLVAGDAVRRPRARGRGPVTGHRRSPAIAEEREVCTRLLTALGARLTDRGEHARGARTRARSEGTCWRR